MLSSTSPTTAAMLPTPVLDALFWVAAVACLVSQVFILRAVWRVVPSVTGSPDVPAPKRASEMAWALLPTLLLLGAFAGAWRLMHPPVPSDPSVSRGASVAPASRA
ncbi:MAG: hypothetical protein KA154_16865 [Gemmatimonadaceae bacterium]|nr:hypothetical protein [Gemmatimonadaceae bacterium]MCC6429369.1 hypothetical protein [Gemmatimonadaceae bacterium]